MLVDRFGREITKEDIGSGLFKYSVPGLEVIIDSDGKAINKQYDETLFEKITNKKCNILIVNNDDLGYNDLIHLICAKENIFVLKNIVTKILGNKKSTGIGKDITEIYRLAENNEHLLKEIEELKKNTIIKNTALLKKRKKRKKKKVDVKTNHAIVKL
jgi:hypothetical protein